MRYSVLVVTVGLCLGRGDGVLADPPASTEAAQESSSTSDEPKSLPRGSIFSSVEQSFKSNPELEVVRGHFELGSPPDVHRYYCLVNTKTGNRESNGVMGDPVPRKDGMTGIKNIAVSLYRCADAQQQGMLVTTGYVLSGAASRAPTPARSAPATAAAPTPAPAAAQIPAPPPVAVADRVAVSPEQIDVGGVKLGMSPDDVRAVLKSKKLLHFDESAETLSYLDAAKGVMQPISNGHFVNVIAAWSPPPPAAADDGFVGDGESYEVMFTPVPGKERVMGIIHSVGYSTANAIHETALESGLINKYGGFSGSIDLPESPTWRFQAGGNVQVGDSCNRRGVFGGLGVLNVAKTARQNLALKKTPDDFKSQIERCGVALVTEDHFTANGGAMRADRLVTRFTVTAYSPSIAFEGANTAVQLIQAAGGNVKKSDTFHGKDLPPANL